MKWYQDQSETYFQPQKTLHMKTIISENEELQKIYWNMMNIPV